MPNISYACSPIIACLDCQTNGDGTYTAEVGKEVTFRLWPTGCGVLTTDWRIDGNSVSFVNETQYKLFHSFSELTESADLPHTVRAIIEHESDGTPIQAGSNTLSVTVVPGNFYTITILPSSGCTVFAGDGGIDDVESPNGIHCSGNTVADSLLCMEQFSNETIAVLKVQPDPGWEFTSWTLNGAQLTHVQADPLMLTTLPVLAGDVPVVLNSSNAECQANCSRNAVSFKALWETNNKANRIYDPTPMDEHPQIPKYILYIVEDPADGKYHITLEVELSGSDIPEELLNRLMFGVYRFGSENVAQGSIPNTGTVDILITPMELGPTYADYVIRMGYDVNQNSLLEDSEVVKFSIGASGDEPIVHGITAGYYKTALTFLDEAVDWGFTIPNASNLVQIFRDGTHTTLPKERQSILLPPTMFHCFSADIAGTDGDFSSWFPHNSGAPFDDDGHAQLSYYKWDSSTSLGEKLGNYYQIREAGKAFYYAHVQQDVENYLASGDMDDKPVGYQKFFPPTGYHDVPHQHESPSWVPQTSVDFDDPAPNPIFVFFDDVLASIGRGRLQRHQAQFILVKMQADPVTTYIHLLARYKGYVEDLYDFNRDAGGAGEKGAIVQIGHGNGGYGSERDSGVIFRDQIEFDVTISQPLENWPY